MLGIINIQNNYKIVLTVASLISVCIFDNCDSISLNSNAAYSKIIRIWENTSRQQ